VLHKTATFCYVLFLFFVFYGTTTAAVDSNIASGPLPEDGASPITIDSIDIQWTPGTEASSHDVYFGDDFNEVDVAAPLKADISKTGQVDLEDVMLVAQQWLTDGSGQPSADISEDGNVSLTDFSLVAKQWLQTGLFRGNQTLGEISFQGQSGINQL